MRDSRQLNIRSHTMDYEVSTNNPMGFESSENLHHDVGFKSSPKHEFQSDSLHTKSDKIKRWDKKRMLLDKYLDEVLRNVCTNKAQEPPVLPTLGHRHYSGEHDKGARQKENFHMELPSLSSTEEYDDRCGLNSQSYSTDCIPQMGSLKLESDVISSYTAGPPCGIKSERYEDSFFSQEQGLMNPNSHDYYAETHHYPNGIHEEETVMKSEYRQYIPDDAYMTESPPSSCRDDVFSELWPYDEEPLDLSIPKEESSFHNTSFYSDCYDVNPSEFPSKEESGQQNVWLKKIKTGTRSRVRSPKSWEFLLRLLMDNTSNPSMIRWEDKAQGTFRLVQKDEIAKIWGMRSSKHKDGGLSYDNFARNLRYHYKTKMLVPVSEKHLVYKFSPEVMQKMRSLIN